MRRAHGSDKSGPYAGVPYDGNDPAYADLYHDYSKGAPALAAGRGIGSTDAGPDWWQRTWFNRIKDLVDRYQPDLLYSDGRLPFESYGLSVVANLYNLSAKAWRPRGVNLQQQAEHGLRDRCLRAGPGTNHCRPGLAVSLADGHLCR
jgi:alpha-L-fucosidase